MFDTKKKKFHFAKVYDVDIQKYQLKLKKTQTFSEVFLNLEDRYDAKMIPTIYMYKEKDKERKKISFSITTFMKLKLQQLWVNILLVKAQKEETKYP